LIAPARRLAHSLLCRIDSEGLFSDAALNSAAVAQLEPRDRHLVTELVMGTLRWQGKLDHVLARQSSRPWNEVEPRVRCLLRMSLHQMWNMDRIPDHAIVNDAVEIAKHQAGRGAEKFVNAILRRLGREQPWEAVEKTGSFPPWARASLPRWLWERWSERFGESRAEEYALSLNVPPRTVFRIGAGADSLPSDAEFEASELVPGAFWSKTAGREPEGIRECPVRIQDEGSQLIPQLLGPVPGLRIWDACAAPGGKSAILLENAATFVVSSDLSRQRAGRMSRALAGKSGTATLILDAAATPPFRCRFDAVLADVPCSGLGTLRRNPEIKWHLKPEQLSSFSAAQEQILAAVSRAVRAGGRLLYSTCSTEPEENEDVVMGFLSRQRDFTLEKPVHPREVEAFLDGSGFLRTFPGTRLWDGFFAALLLRR
jgi:16S rRNA (cytosine967-C5)-methyltransferase